MVELNKTVTGGEKDSAPGTRAYSLFIEKLTNWHYTGPRSWGTYELALHLGTKELALHLGTNELTMHWGTLLGYL